MAAPSGITWGSIQGSYGRIGIYTSLSNTNATTTVTVQVWVWTKYSIDETYNTFYYDNNSTSASTNRGSVRFTHSVNSGAGWSTSNQTQIATYTHTISRGVSDMSITCAAKLAGVDRVGSTMTCTRTYTIPKLPSYTVSYNLNGGSGAAPASQTKWYGINLSLSSSKPSRTGYTFLGWSTSSSSTSATYQSGGTYSSNAGATLYAVWKIVTYTVKFNANGGTGAPGDQTKNYGTTLVLSNTKPTRPEYNFLGWSTSSTATSPTYLSGGKYTTNAGATLYAVWEVAYVKPRIFNLSVFRSTSDGTESSSGTNALVSFTWECDKTISSIIIKWKLPTDSSWNSSTVSASGTSGTTSAVVGSDEISTDHTYDIEIVVTDQGGNNSATTNLPTMKFIFDYLLTGQTGVAFGKAAEVENLADFGFNARFNESVYGNVTGLNVLPEIPSDSDLNNYLSTGCWAIYKNIIAATISNVPVEKAGRLEVWSSTGEGIRSSQYSYLRQRFTGYLVSDGVWERNITRDADNIWSYSDWTRTDNIPGKLLWSGGYYMSDTQKANLSSPISTQASGIVLTFCKYDASTAQMSDNNFNHFFVPKAFINSFNGYGNAFTMMDINFGQICHKYLYIHDTYITGHANNIATGTGASGITYANNKYVLRYVYGV